MGSLIVFVGLGLYLIGFPFFAYFCVFADPESSPVADLLTRRVPEYVGSKLVRIVGKETMDILQTVYLVAVLGGWWIMFAYGYPWITESTHVSSFHKYVGYAVFVSCMASWRYACNASPGFITARTLSKFDNYPYDNLLFVPNRICPTAGIPRLARSKYDRFSRVHVARFDHFCGWLHNPIGEENYRFFLLFLLAHVAMCFYGTYVTACLFHGEIIDKQLLEVTFFNTATGEEFKADWFVVSQYFFQHNVYMSGVLILMGFVTILVGAFLGYHIWITSRGMTTNEHVKWGQVKKWHRKKQKRYKEAVKAGLVPVNNTATSELSSVVTDGDVGCTGAVLTAEESEETAEELPLMDPGPMPKNIYNQGFVENWKDVFFPRSMRKEALERWTRSLQDMKSQDELPLQQPTKPKAS